MIYRNLNLNKIKSRKHSIIITKTALKGITPINLYNAVLTGNKKETLQWCSFKTNFNPAILNKGWKSYLKISLNKQSQ